MRCLTLSPRTIACRVLGYPLRGQASVHSFAFVDPHPPSLPCKITMSSHLATRDHLAMAAAAHFQDPHHRDRVQDGLIPSSGGAMAEHAGHMAAFQARS